MPWPTWSGSNLYPDVGRYAPGVEPDTGKGLAAGISQAGGAIGGAIEKHETDLTQDAANDYVISQAIQSGQMNPEVLGYKLGDQPSPAEMWAKYKGGSRTQQKGWTAGVIGDVYGKWRRQTAETTESLARADYLKAQAEAETSPTGVPTVASVRNPITGEPTDYATVVHGKSLQVVPVGQPRYATDPETGQTTVVHGRTMQQVSQQDILLAKIAKDRDAKLAAAAEEARVKGTPGVYDKAKKALDDAWKAVVGTPPPEPGAAAKSAAPVTAAPTGPTKGVGPTKAGVPVGKAGESVAGDARTNAINWLARNGYVQNEANIQEILRQMGASGGQ